MRRLHHHVLHSKVKDCKILEAATISEGRAQLETEKLDLIIMEVVLPDGSGFEFCKEAKALNIPVLIMTELSSGQHMLQGFNAGCSYYMVKDDYDPDILEAVVVRLLSGEHRSPLHLQTGLKIALKDDELELAAGGLDSNVKHMTKNTLK